VGAVAILIDSVVPLRHDSGMTDRASAGRPEEDDDTALLIATLDHCWAWYDAGIGRGLQVLNYYLVAIAVLATAYVSALNAKLYAVAAVIGLSGAALTAVSYGVGTDQTKFAHTGMRALREVQDRIADRIGIESVRMGRARPIWRVTPLFSHGAFVLAATLSIGSVVYALIR
jgi:hypothetical protein